MTHLISKIDSINKLVFEPITAKVIKSIKAVRVEGTTVVLGANGVVYVSGIKGRLAYPFTTRSLESALTACIKMGVLTPAAVEQHRAHQKARSLAREQMWSADSIVSNAKTLGLKLTKAQQKLIEKAQEKCRT